MASTVYLRWQAMFWVLMAAETAYQGAFSGSGHTVPAFAINLVDTVLRIPAAWLLAFPLGMGIDGVWLAIAGCPNVAVDTSGGDPDSGITESAVSTLGPDRIVYGSDAAIRHFGVQLGKVLGIDMPQTIKRDILWNNTARRLPEWAGVKLLEGALR